VTPVDPQIVRAEEPQDRVLEVPRTALGLRGVMMLTLVVTIAAILLVILLYLSPLAQR
jgi:hypothetical protein